MWQLFKVASVTLVATMRRGMISLKWKRMALFASQFSDSVRAFDHMDRYDRSFPPLRSLGLRFLDLLSKGRSTARTVAPS